MRSVLKQLFFDAEDFLQEGDFARAIKTYEVALSKAKKDDSEEYLALNYLGMAYEDAGNEKKANEVFKRSQQLAMKLYGADSMEYALALSNEGMVNCIGGKLLVTEPVLDEAVRILQVSRKPTNPELIDPGNIIEVYSNAADCKAKLGKVAEAIELLQRCFQAAESTLPPNHPRRIQAAIELEALRVAAGRSKVPKSFTEDLFKVLQRSGINPLQAIYTFAEAITNVSCMLDGLEEKPAKNPSRSKRGPAAVSNVVPLSSAKSAGAKSNSRCTGYQLKISLKYVSPPIWRRVVVSADCSLHKLHSVIQRAMGWEDDHLHEFRVRKVRFGDPACTEAKDEYKYKLRQFNFKVGSKFEYEYDFGDGWQHLIQVEKSLDAIEFEASDTFVDGKGGCPPEDCGGPHGFACLLEALKNPDPDQEEWLDDYDAEKLPSCFQAKKSESRKSTKKVLTPSPS